jgi:hypothetical protein
MLFPNIIAVATIGGMTAVLYHVANSFAPFAMSAALATLQAALGL